MKPNFEKIYNESIKNSEEFWKKIADDIFWFKKPNKILNKSNPPFYRWFEDGVTNTCYNALDIHIDQGRGDKLALIYDSPITGNKKKFRYNELKKKVSKFSGFFIEFSYISLKLFPMQIDSNFGYFLSF